MREIKHLLFPKIWAGNLCATNESAIHSLLNPETPRVGAEESAVTYGP